MRSLRLIKARNSSSATPTPDSLFSIALANKKPWDANTAAGDEALRLMASCGKVALRYCRHFNIRYPEKYREIAEEAIIKSGGYQYEILIIKDSFYSKNCGRKDIAIRYLKNIGERFAIGYSDNMKARWPKEAGLISEIAEFYIAKGDLKKLKNYTLRYKIEWDSKTMAGKLALFNLAYCAESAYNYVSKIIKRPLNAEDSYEAVMLAKIAGSSTHAYRYSKNIVGMQWDHDSVLGIVAFNMIKGTNFENAYNRLPKTNSKGQA